MNHETHNSATCERADDLVVVLYGEATEQEKRDFELHLKQCGNCRAEFNAFAMVRESIGEWRDEALNGFVASHVTPAPVRKSALAALRQFFDLSPLWLKGAVGFAVVVFCVLAAVAVFRLQTSTHVATGNAEKTYTKQEVDRFVQEALANQQLRRESLAQQEALPQKQREQRGVERRQVVMQSSGSRNTPVAKSGRVPKAQRPFTKAEREQLAAELRLISGSNESDFDFPDK